MRALLLCIAKQMGNEVVRVEFCLTFREAAVGRLPSRSLSLDAFTVSVRNRVHDTGDLYKGGVVRPVQRARILKFLPHGWPIKSIPKLQKLGNTDILISRIGGWNSDEPKGKRS